MLALVSGAAGTVDATALTLQAAEAEEMELAGTVVAAGTAEAAEVAAAGSVEVV